MAGSDDDRAHRADSDARPDAWADCDGNSDSNDENRAGRYLMEVGNYSVIWYDSHTGEIIGQVGNQELGKIFGSEKLSTYEGILNKINND